MGLDTTDLVQRLRECLRFDEANSLESELEKCAREAADAIERLAGKAEPVAWMNQSNRELRLELDRTQTREWLISLGWTPLYAHPAAPTEPVAWVAGNQGGSSGDWVEVRYVHGDAAKFKIGDALYAHPAAPAPRLDLKKIVDRFLSWRLPQSFSPDGHISFDRDNASATPHSWPTGTNLFTFSEALAMFEHALEMEEPSVMGGGWVRDCPAAPAPDDDSLTIAYLMGYEDCRAGMEKRKWAQKVEAAMKEKP